jgi:hypothetical protein
LVKWYMDCVTEEGDVAIVYCADLRWHGVHAVLCSVLEGNEEHVGTSTSISSYRVSSDGGRISADLPKLGVSGTWEADAAPVERTVYEHGAGHMHWNCLQPRSLVRVRIGDRELSGLGYAECLTMTIPPWQLPMCQLRWGRFVSPQDSLVWVDWQGTYETSFAIMNGNEFKPLTVSETAVAVDGTTLRIEAGLPLRSGRLGSTILPGAPAIAKLLPLSIFNVEEHKWRSRGELAAQDRTSGGWVIHEVVHWKI